MTTKARRSINKLFIANRGEIARRIALGARKLGIPSVAITEKYPPAFLVGIVAEFVSVETESPALYLDIKTMVDLARKSGCDAIHPGFGFLSENAGFAAACDEAGLTWIGPSAKSIEAMASKAHARELAKQAKVPCIDGLENVQLNAKNPDYKIVQDFAKRAGFPLLFKAALGGGGKGMRVVNKMDEIPEAASRASSEALNSFGDSTLVVERYLQNPRHVEVQILGDTHGNVVAIGDRDCSVQRRHQKIIEEAPAPNLAEVTRQAMHTAAIRLAKAVSYHSAGTVEFLVDWSEAARKKATPEFFFLEMNTRLQVEHPVSEEAFGLDLVEWQLRIALGEALPTQFANLQPHAHSIELRVYAEDVAQNFFPAPGPVCAFVPADGPGIRWEVGLDSVDNISSRFDPMIAKLIATAADRDGACKLLIDAIDRTFLATPRHNLELLRAILAESSFAKGAVSTDFIPANRDALMQSIERRRAKSEPILQAILQEITTNGVVSAEASQFGASISSDAVIRAAFVGTPATSKGSRKMTVVETTTVASARNATPTQIGRGLFAYDGRQESFHFALRRGQERSEVWVGREGCAASLVKERRSSSGTAVGAADQSQSVPAPVPGKVIAARVAVGDAVKTNQTLFIIESMKMEFEIKAAKDGKIGRIHFKHGDQVNAGDVLATYSDN